MTMTNDTQHPETEPTHDCATGPVGRPVPRRRLLAAGVSLAALGLAGCAGDTTSTGTPTPVGLGGGKQCDVCGMVIEEHPGPSAVTFFADASPENHEGPAWFDSVKERFVYVRGKEARGWEPTATYVTDYSTVDYEVTESRGTPLISRHVDPASFVAASEVTYLAGSDVEGAMGVELLPFSVREDAAAFREEYGGWLVAHDDVDGETLRKLRTSDDE